MPRELRECAKALSAGSSGKKILTAKETLARSQQILKVTGTHGKIRVCLGAQQVSRRSQRGCGQG